MDKIILGIFVILIVSCNTSETKTGKISTEGYFKCFEENTIKDNGKPYTCEPSTAVYYNNEIFLANDKVFPNNNSSVFSFKFDKGVVCNSKKYYNIPAFKYIDKFEASTITPDNKFFIFSSAFSYPATDSVHGKKHNTAIFVNTDNIEKNGVLHISETQENNSIDIKNKIVEALKSKKFPNGPNYLKIEGLTVIPNNKLLFGIREIGPKYGDFEFQIKILSVDYIIENEQIKLVGDISVVYDYIPDNSLDIELPLGLSSIEYSPYDNNIYMTTSFEHADDSKNIGAYLWYLSLEDFNAKKAPNLILDKNKKPLLFTHKIEGLTVIDKNTLFLVGDDDRITGEQEENPDFIRKLNQAYWAIVNIF